MAKCAAMACKQSPVSGRAFCMPHWMMLSEARRSEIDEAGGNAALRNRLRLQAALTIAAAEGRYVVEGSPDAK